MTKNLNTITIMVCALEGEAYTTEVWDRVREALIVVFTEHALNRVDRVLGQLTQHDVELMVHGPSPGSPDDSCDVAPLARAVVDEIHTSVMGIPS